VFALRWFRDNRDITALARDHGISRATGCSARTVLAAMLRAAAGDRGAAGVLSEFSGSLDGDTLVVAVNGYSLRRHV
jgi:hypothetical protein